MDIDFLPLPPLFTRMLVLKWPPLVPEEGEGCSLRHSTIRVPFDGIKAHDRLRGSWSCPMDSAFTFMVSAREDNFVEVQAFTSNRSAFLPVGPALVTLTVTEPGYLAAARPA